MVFLWKKGWSKLLVSKAKWYAYRSTIKAVCMACKNGLGMFCYSKDKDPGYSLVDRVAGLIVSNKVKKIWSNSSSKWAVMALREVYKSTKEQ